MSDLTPRKQSKLTEAEGAFRSASKETLAAAFVPAKHATDADFTGTFIDMFSPVS